MTTATRLTAAELLLGEMSMTGLALLEHVRENVSLHVNAKTLALCVRLSEQIDAASELIGKAPKRRQEAARN